LPLKEKDMFTDHQLTTAKAVPIAAYLQAIGHNPVKQSNQEFVYYSPVRVEATPSFYVNIVKNVFTDFGGIGVNGDAIKLVQYLTDCSFVKAVNVLLEFDGATIQAEPATFSFSGQNKPRSDGKTSDSSGILIKEVKTLKNAALCRYVESRGIPAPLANEYLKEVHFEQKGQRLFAVGFANDGGGYTLRNKVWKCTSTPNTVTTLPAANNDVLNVFEGFFDFLAACVHFGHYKPSNTTIVLNSTSNLLQVLERIKTAKRVNVFLDNDKTGIATAQKIAANNPNTVNHCNIYDGYKDFSEYINI
jgi:DNA primase